MENGVRQLHLRTPFRLVQPQPIGIMPPRDHQAVPRRHRIGIGDAQRQFVLQQAARHGRSMEEEARTILREAIEASQPSAATKQGLGSRIHAHFAPFGGVELELPQRSSQPTPAQFGAEP